LFSSFTLQLEQFQPLRHRFPRFWRCGETDGQTDGQSAPFYILRIGKTMT
jgi:hypothetical protein